MAKERDYWFENPTTASLDFGSPKNRYWNLFGGVDNWY
jgi:hypothetical protein